MSISSAALGKAWEHLVVRLEEGSRGLTQQVPVFALQMESGWGR